MPQALWSLSIEALDSQSGKAVPGLVVEVWDKDFSRVKSRDDLLFVATTDSRGACRASFGANAFQDKSARHLDGGRPDIFFRITDLQGNVVHLSPVHTNVAPGKHSFSFKIEPLATTIVQPRTVSRSQWIIDGRVKSKVAQRFVVESFDKELSSALAGDDWLFTATTDGSGRFSHTFWNWSFRRRSKDRERHPDLFFVVKDLGGSVLYTSPVTPNVRRGAYDVVLDLDALSTQLGPSTQMAATSHTPVASPKSPTAQQSRTTQPTSSQKSPSSSGSRTSQKSSTPQSTGTSQKAPASPGSRTSQKSPAPPTPGSSRKNP